VIVAGTEADGFPDERNTTVPAALAAPLSVTVPVEFFPPSTDVGFKVTAETDTGLTVKVAV
jgi:hypothetical protein